MVSNIKLAAVLLAGLAGPAAAGAQQCAGGFRVEGVVVDPNGSTITGAQVLAGDGEQATTDAQGKFALACVPANAATFSVEASGFAATSMAAGKPVNGVARLRVLLPLARVDTDVQVGTTGDSLDPDHGLGTHTLSGKQLDELADDPDDLTRQLQILAAANGGTPGAAKITVDGFQNSSALPPKSSIARIVTAPDMFSTEYQEAPYDGGRIEIYTKPGADTYHGALFFIDSDSSFNATDPFSTTPTPASKQRYGFELNGPISKKTSDFNLALEKRDINEFNVVNAQGLDANNQPVAISQTVAAPQRLWIASARADWQVNPNDIATLSFSANVNDLGNQGVGGLTLEDAGYGSHVSEYDLRFTDTHTFSANLLNEAHIGWSWKDTAQTPTSTAPSVQVSGYFTGGGNTSQYLNTRERDLEIDDDVLLTKGKHSFKIGEQAFGNFVHEEDPNTFNGAYTFGGTATVNALQQYQDALEGLTGGTPTTYQSTTGTALVPLAQWRLGLYLEDVVKLNKRVTASGGLRYTLQSSPGSYANFAPRVGIAWAVDKQSKTVVHLRAGLFDDPVDQGLGLEAERLNGVRQIEHLIYSPSYTAPLTPVPGAISVSTVRSLPSSYDQIPSFQGMAGLEHDFPHHWHPQANLIYIDAWNISRSRNINAPEVVSSNNTVPDLTAALTAPRPFAPNENIFQYEETGHLKGPILFFGLDQHAYKRFGFFAGYVYMHLTEDAVQNAGFVQSAYSNAGEASRPDWQRNHQFFAFGNYTLPYKTDLSAELDGNSGQAYNITTGTDNNGDGNFNDRPSYAVAGNTDVYPTRFGALTTDTVNGDVQRNLGTMPMKVHLDMNLSRAWKIGPQKADHPRTLTLNARSANIINHTNVTAVSTVVSSPTFSQSLAAEAARRLELGARFTF
jgi:hypothetical protein